CRQRLSVRRGARRGRRSGRADGLGRAAAHEGGGMSITAAIRRMLDAGLTLEQALTAAECFEAVSPAPRTARQERNARYYQKKATEKRLNKTDQDASDDSDACDLPSSPEVSPHTPLPNPSNHLPP